MSRLICEKGLVLFLVPQRHMFWIFVRIASLTNCYLLSEGFMTVKLSLYPRKYAEGVYSFRRLCLSVRLSVHLSHYTHEWVVRWLRIMDSFNVFEWDLFCQPHETVFYVAYFLLHGYFLAT